MLGPQRCGRKIKRRTSGLGGQKDPNLAWEDECGSTGEGKATVVWTGMRVKVRHDYRCPSREGSLVGGGQAVRAKLGGHGWRTGIAETDQLQPSWRSCQAQYFEEGPGATSSSVGKVPRSISEAVLRLHHFPSWESLMYCFRPFLASPRNKQRCPTSLEKGLMQICNRRIRSRKQCTSLYPSYSHLGNSISKTYRWQARTQGSSPSG